MHGSVGQAQVDDDERIVIYQSTDREGSTFALSPETKRALQERFGDKLHASPRIFIAHGAPGAPGTRDDMERLHGRLAKQLLALLTGFDDELLARIGAFEFRNPVTDQLL
jgi:hypothetical protein